MSNITKGEQFQVGEVWVSPKGYFYKVTECKGVQVTLRMNIHGTGRKVLRNKYKIIGWTLEQ